MDLDVATQSVVDQLTAAGVRATSDGRDLNPPCVLVYPPTLHFRFGKPTYDAEFEALALVPATGTSGELKTMGPLITQIVDALNGYPTTGTPGIATIGDGSTVPMYRLTWTQRIPA